MYVYMDDFLPITFHGGILARCFFQVHPWPKGTTLKIGHPKKPSQNRPGPKRKFLFQPPIFRDVSLPEGNYSFKNLSFLAIAKKGGFSCITGGESKHREGSSWKKTSL